MPLNKHGSPADRGGADRYYGRPYCPHYYPEGTYKGERIVPPVMTAAQVEEYSNAYETEENRKDWGVDSSSHCECDTEEE